jgi:hypothetical protein
MVFRPQISLTTSSAINMHHLALLFYHHLRRSISLPLIACEIITVFNQRESQIRTCAPTVLIIIAAHKHTGKEHREMYTKLPRARRIVCTLRFYLSQRSVAFAYNALVHFFGLQQAEK